MTKELNIYLQNSFGKSKKVVNHFGTKMKAGQRMFNFLGRHRTAVLFVLGTVGVIAGFTVPALLAGNAAGAVNGAIFLAKRAATFATLLIPVVVNEVLFRFTKKSKISRKKSALNKQSKKQSRLSKQLEKQKNAYMTNRNQITKLVLDTKGVLKPKSEELKSYKYLKKMQLKMQKQMNKTFGKMKATNAKIKSTNISLSTLIDTKRSKRSEKKLSSTKDLKYIKKLEASKFTGNVRDSEYSVYHAFQFMKHNSSLQEYQEKIVREKTQGYINELVQRDAKNLGLDYKLIEAKQLSNETKFQKRVLNERVVFDKPKQAWQASIQKGAPNINKDDVYNYQRDIIQANNIANNMNVSVDTMIYEYDTRSEPKVEQKAEQKPAKQPEPVQAQQNTQAHQNAHSQQNTQTQQDNKNKDDEKAKAKEKEQDKKEEKNQEKANKEANDADLIARLKKMEEEVEALRVKNAEMKAIIDAMNKREEESKPAPAKRGRPVGSKNTYKGQIIHKVKIHKDGREVHTVYGDPELLKDAKDIVISDSPEHAAKQTVNIFPGKSSKDNERTK